MSILFADVDLRKNGGGPTLTKGADALRGKIVGLYISASWCPMSRTFTNVLKKFHREIGEDFEVVFVSWDHTEQDMKKHLESHGNWYYIRFCDSVSILQKYLVRVIPTLIIINANGEVITKNGRRDVFELTPVQALTVWKRRQNGKKRKDMKKCSIM